MLHENPSGWRGYARKMRQVGRYHADLVERPHSMVRFTVFHAARMVKCVARDIRRGDLFEATADSLLISSQVMGTWDIWRSDRSSESSQPSAIEQQGGVGRGLMKPSP